MSKIIELKHSILYEDPENRPSGMDRKKLDELKDSILENGLLQNLEAEHEPDGKGREHKVIIGNRRLRVCGELIAEIPGLIAKETDGVRKAMLVRRLNELENEMPVRVLDADQAKHAKERQLVENLQREDVSPVDEARGFNTLKEKYKLTGAEIARRIGKQRTPDYVENRIKLLRAPKRLLEALAAGLVKVRSCERVGRIPSKEDREKIVPQILDPKRQDEPLSDAQIAALIEAEYVVSLATCHFDTQSEGLVPIKFEGGERVSGGPCSTCPFRTGNMPGLADELATGSTSGKGGKTSGIDPNRCTNPACFRAKRDEAWKKIEADAAKENRETINAERAKKIFNSWDEKLPYDSEWVDLSDTPGSRFTGHYNDEKTPKWNKLLEGTDAPETLVRHPKTGAIHRLVKAELAVEAVKTKFKGQNKPSPFDKAKGGGSSGKSKAEKDKAAAEREKTKLEWATTHECMTRVRAAIAKMGLNHDRATTVATIAMHEAGSDGQFVLCKWLGLEKVKTKYGSGDYEKPLTEFVKTIRDEKDLLGIALVAMTMRYGKHHPAGSDQFKALLKAWDIKREDAAAAAKAALKPAEKGKGKPPLVTVTKSKSAARNQAVLDAVERGEKPAGDTIYPLLKVQREIAKKKAGKKSSKSKGKK